MKNKMLIVPVLLSAFAVFNIASNNIHQSMATIATENTSAAKEMDAEALYNLPISDSDKGVIKGFSSSSFSGGFTVTYINESNKVQITSSKNLFVVGDVTKFEGSSFVKRVVTKDSLPKDKMTLLINSISATEKEADFLTKTLEKGNEIVLGFIVNQE